jgi:DNA gyrase inhibitor GyrI
MPRGIPLLDIIGSQLELERGRYAVARLKPVVRVLLSVLMQIYESWRDDQSARINRLFPN